MYLLHWSDIELGADNVINREISLIKTFNLNQWYTIIKTCTIIFSEIILIIPIKIKIIRGWGWNTIYNCDSKHKYETVFILC